MGVGGGEQSCPLTRQEKALERGGRKKQRRDRGFGLNLKLLVCKSPSGAASDMSGHTPQQAKNVHSQAAFFGRTWDWLTRSLGSQQIAT